MYWSTDGTTGKIRWKHIGGYRHRFAQRGLVFWPGDENSSGTLFLMKSDKLIAINPENGELKQDFGAQGMVKLTTGSRIAPVLMKNMIIIATSYKRNRSLFAVL